MRCFGFADESCTAKATYIEYESQQVPDPDNPNGPTVYPGRCRKHYYKALDTKRRQYSQWRKNRPL